MFFNLRRQSFQEGNFHRNLIKTKFNLNALKIFAAKSTFDFETKIQPEVSRLATFYPRKQKMQLQPTLVFQAAIHVHL